MKDKSIYREIFIGLAFFLALINLIPSMNSLNNKDEIDIWIDDDYDSSTPGWQYDHFDDIQEGINAAPLNGTIFVYDGEYLAGRAGIIIDKSIKLIGENKENTKIIGHYSANAALTILNKYVEVSNFTIRSCIIQDDAPFGQAGVRITPPESSNKTIKIFNNYITKNTNGIYVAKLAPIDMSNTSVFIYKNKIWNNSLDGVIIDVGSFNNTIYDNEIYENKRQGIGLWGAYYACDSINTIIKNEIHNNKLDGIWNDQKDNTIIIDNNIFDNARNGITFFNSDYLRLKYFNICTNCHVIGNNITGNGYDSEFPGGGIFLYHSKNNIFHDNLIVNNNKYGIKIVQTINFTEYFTVDQPSSTNNYIYQNNIINNYKINAVETMINPFNQWYFNGVGNYWSDYDGAGIYEIPIQIRNKIIKFIAGSKDIFPCTKKNEWLDGTPRIPEKPEGDDYLDLNDEKKYYYSTSTIDINDEDIAFKFDWGDGNNSSWLGPYKSGENCISKGYKWNKEGDYYVRVKAKDVYNPNVNDPENIIDGESDWSEALIVRVREDIH